MILGEIHWKKSWNDLLKIQTVSTHLLYDMKNGKIKKPLSFGEWKMLFVIVNKKFNNYEKKLSVYYDQLSPYLYTPSF